MPSATPSPNAGSSRPLDITASVAISLASTIGLRPGSTSTLMPNLSRVVRPAAYDIGDDRIGRLAGDPLGQPQAVEAEPLDRVDEVPELRAVQRRPHAEADTDAHLHGPIVARSAAGSCRSAGGCAVTSSRDRSAGPAASGRPQACQLRANPTTTTGTRMSDDRHVDDGLEQHA